MYFLPLPTQARLKELLDYNEETGVFIWKAKPSNRVKVGDVAGYGKVYNSIRIDGKSYQAHRLAWMYITNEDPGELEIDHKDENKHNNIFSNLRKGSSAQNKMNRGAYKNNKTGLKGVRLIKNRYCASIRNNGKLIHLGCYDTPEQAHTAYCEAADKYHGEYANYG